MYKVERKNSEIRKRVPMLSPAVLLCTLYYPEERLEWSGTSRIYIDNIDITHVVFPIPTITLLFLQC